MKTRIQFGSCVSRHLHDRWPAARVRGCQAAGACGQVIDLHTTNEEVFNDSITNEFGADTNYQSGCWANGRTLW